MDDIGLSKGCRIRRIAKEEVEFLDGRSLLGPIGLLTLGLVGISHVIEFRPKRTGPGHPVRVNPEEFDHCITALRLAAPSGVDYNYSAVSHLIPGRKPGEPSSGSWTLNRPIPVGDAYELTENKVRQVRALFERLLETDKAQLQLATRRFNASYERKQPHDRIVDYWVALESLFLPTEASELRFRAAVRIAYFLEKSAGKRKTVYDHVLESYDLRSWIVHGESKGKRQKKRWTSEKIKNVALATHEIVRSCLSASILARSKPQTELLDKSVAQGSVYPGVSPGGTKSTSR